MNKDFVQQNELIKELETIKARNKKLVKENELLKIDL